MNKELIGLQKLCSNKPIDVVIIAAEPSADVHGAHITKQLLKLSPHLSIAAIAGPLMRKLPIEIMGHMEDLQVMGFIDVALSLPKIIRQFYKIKRCIKRLNPKVVFFIDYPGFNLKLAQHIKESGFKGTLIQYVCPTVWAWKKNRIQHMEKYLDLLIHLFPFEKECFNNSQLSTLYFGHPLAQVINQTKCSSLGSKKDYLTIFPGSRKKEIEKNFALQLFIAQKLSKEFHLPIQVVAANRDIKSLLLSLDPKLSIVDNAHLYEQMQKTKLAIATSGTITLELALFEVPTIVTYAIRPFDQWLATKVFKINLPFYCIVNIVAKKEIFPEFFGSNFQASKALGAARKILNDKIIYEKIQNQCHEIANSLYCPDSDKKIAQTIIQYL